MAACDKPQPAAEIRPVRTVTAVAGSDGEPVSLTGHIRARTEQSVAFRIDGRMISRRVGVGDVVRPNDLVAELDPQPKRDALREAQAKLAAAEAALHEASNNMERKRTLTNQGWSTKVEFDAAERSFNSAKAKVDVAKAQLHAAEDQLSYTKLLADAPGVVISTGAEAGEVVRAGQTIVTVAHYDGVDAVFDVPASLMRQVSPDALITVALTEDPQNPYHRASAGDRTAGRFNNPKLPGQDRAGRMARNHAARRDRVRADAHAGKQGHRASGDCADHGG